MHTDFIISDIFDVVDDAIMSTSSIGQNIAHYSLCEYLFQSIFLRLTGYQEQKLKCILWEIASDDLDFRYKYLSGSVKVNECSQLSDKNIVYNILKKTLEDKNHPFLFPDEIEINRQISEIKDNLISKFETSVFRKWLPREYSRFIEFSSNIRYKRDGYFTLKSIFGGDNYLNEAFDKLYRHRNRCAHNLLSYQSNVPKLLDFTKDVDGSDNYFTRILLLCMIDNVFTRMFKFYINNR
ncbi:hypothetical protein [Segatella hominis]|uniref:hypothetical protein n=1 Tax=Segatella hominis TaxID=2518605 RepID=UPI003AAC8A20